MNGSEFWDRITDLFANDTPFSGECADNNGEIETTEEESDQ